VGISADLYIDKSSAMVQEQIGINLPHLPLSPWNIELTCFTNMPAVRTLPSTCITSHFPISTPVAGPSTSRPASLRRT
jgi:hypothetical protein